MYPLTINSGRGVESDNVLCSSDVSFESPSKKDWLKFPPTQPSMRSLDCIEDLEEEMGVLFSTFVVLSCEWRIHEKHQNHASAELYFSFLPLGVLSTEKI